MSEEKKGWPLLHSQLPPRALKPLPTDAYGIAGLTDVNEAYLIQRLFASGYQWQWKILGQAYLGHEDRKSSKGYEYRVYLASVWGELIIEGRSFAGSGAHDNKKLDAAFKGAATVAFKNACKVAALTLELYLDGRAIDHIYDSAEKNAATREEPRKEAGTVPAPHTNQPDSGAPSPASTLERARQYAKPNRNGYSLEDAVCPSCGKKEALGPKGAFCAKAKGGCGWPLGKGEKGTPISYGEWLEKAEQKGLAL